MEDLCFETEVFNEHISEKEITQFESLKEISEVIENIHFDDLVSLKKLDFDELIDKTIKEANENNYLISFINSNDEREFEPYNHNDEEQNEKLGIFLLEDLNKFDFISFAEADELNIERPLNVYEKGRKESNDLFNRFKVNKDIEM